MIASIWEHYEKMHQQQHLHFQGWFSLLCRLHTVFASLGWWKDSHLETMGYPLELASTEYIFPED